MRLRAILAFVFLSLFVQVASAQERQVKSANLQKMEAEQERVKAMQEEYAQNAGAEFKFEDKAEKDIGTGDYTRFVSYDFGLVEQGEIVTHEFKFTNIGTEPLIIENALASCGCTVPSFSREAVEPGKKGSIKVIFNSTGRAGLQSKTVTVNSNAKVSPKILMIKAMVEVPDASEVE